MAMRKKDAYASTSKGGKPIKGLGEGLVYTITNYVLWMFLSNFYFLLMNIPVLYVLLATVTSAHDSITPEISIPLMLASLPTGPAAAALFSVMGKLVREKDLNVTRDFFKAYKQNFFQSLLLWAICLAALNLMSLDISIAVANSLPRVVVAGIYLLMFYLCSLLVFVLAIVSRFHLKLKDVIRLGIVYSIRKPHITIGNLFCLGGTAILSVKGLSFLMLFVFSFIALAIMFIHRNIMAEIQERLKADAF